jgi:phosphoglycerate dehydrogenase-like enzyme
MLCALLGKSSHPFLAGLQRHVATTWSFANLEADSPRDELAEAFEAADALIATHFTRDLPRAPKLRLLQVPGAGYDGIDIAAIPADVRLCNVFEHEAGVAEYALLTMLEAAHRVASADQAIRRGDWSRSSRYGGETDSEIAGKTVTIVGLGRIGRAIARRAKAFDMRVVAANRTRREQEPDVDRSLGLDQLHAALAEGDYVVLACALTPETRGLINAAAFAAMKRNTVIVNVARGPVIDEAALWQALSERRIGGAVIDTWWNYPATARDDVASWAHRFDRLDNTILTPHIAGWTDGTVARRTRFMARNLDRLARGEKLENIVAVGGRRA